MSRTKNVRAGTLRAEIAKRKLTRRALAREMGVSYDYVCKILRGERKSAERKAQIAEILKRRAA